MSSYRRARADNYSGNVSSDYYEDRRYFDTYPRYRDRSPIRRGPFAFSERSEVRREPLESRFYNPSPSVLARYNYAGGREDRRSVRFSRNAGGAYEEHLDRSYRDGHYEDPYNRPERGHYDGPYLEEDQIDDPSGSFSVTDEWRQEEDSVEHGRPWLPPQAPGTPSQDSTQDEVANASTSRDVLQGEGAQGAGGQEPYFVPIHICKELLSLLTDGITTEQSKAGSKEFPLSFGLETFTIKPPKLDSWATRRAKDKGVLKAVNSSEETLTKVHLKIMDIGQPLIAFYSRVQALMKADNPQQDLITPIEDLMRALQVSLQQWGRAFSYLTKLRRKAVVGLVDPRFTYLLKEKEALPSGQEARELLLSSTFIDFMLKEAKTDEILSKADRAASATRKKVVPTRGAHTKPAYGTSGLLPGKSSTHQNPQTETHPRIGPSGRGSREADHRRYANHVPRYGAKLDLRTDRSIKVGARILQFAGNWAAITKDKWVIDAVTYGVLIEFASRPVQYSLPHPVAMSEAMKRSAMQK